MCVCVQLGRHDEALEQGCRALKYISYGAVTKASAGFNGGAACVEAGAHAAVVEHVLLRQPPSAASGSPSNNAVLAQACGRCEMRLANIVYGGKWGLTGVWPGGSSDGTTVFRTSDATCSTQAQLKELRPVLEANFGTLASVANRWPIGLAHQHSGFSFAFPGHNAPPIAARGARIAGNSHALHRHSNWHSWPHRHTSAPLPSCAPAHAPTCNLCTGASAHRPRLMFRFIAWPGMFRFTPNCSASFALHNYKEN